MIPILLTLIPILLKNRASQCATDIMSDAPNSIWTASQL